jgi:hypothetical protein
MSYRCNICWNPVPAGTPCHKRVLKTRIKHYPEREHANREWREVKEKWKLVWIPDPGGVGYETVREVDCCPQCTLEFSDGKIPSR